MANESDKILDEITQRFNTIASDPLAAQMLTRQVVDTLKTLAGIPTPMIEQMIEIAGQATKPIELENPLLNLIVQHGTKQAERGAKMLVAWLEVRKTFFESLERQGCEFNPDIK